MNPDTDLRLSERLRPSKEAVMAQKGPHLFQAVIESALEGMSLRAKEVVLVVNFTPHVEDCGVAIFNLRQAAEHYAGNEWNARRLFYISITEQSTSFATGVARVHNEICDAWAADKLPGYRGGATNPGLTSEEVEDIPDGVLVHEKKWDTIALQTLSRKGNDMEVSPGLVTEYRGAPPDFVSKFERLVANHDAHFRHLLVPLFTGTAADGENPDEEGMTVGGERCEHESLAALQATNQVLDKCVSAVPGIHIIVGKAGQRWLLSDKDRILAKHQRLGGFGTALGI